MRTPVTAKHAAGPAPVPAPVGGQSRAPSAQDLSDRGQRLAALAQLAQHGPSAIAQRQRLRSLFGASAGPAAPVQRMVIYADAVEEIDKVISADFAYQHAMASGARLTLDGLMAAARGTFRIEPDEPVVVTGHGKPGSVQGRSAEDIAKALAKITNIEKALFIYIASCDAATDKEGEPKSSVVDITHRVIAERTRLARQPGVRVLGAPGIAVNDFRGDTGDTQTHYLKATQDDACAVEDLITHYTEMHDIKSALGVKSLQKAEELGEKQIQDPDFQKFYKIFIQTLGGIDRAMIGTLIAACDEAVLSDADDDTTWPTWLAGWVDHEFGRLDEEEVTRSDICAALLTEAIPNARDALARMRDDKSLTLISRADRGTAPLVGIEAGGSEGKPTGFSRLQAEARWYRDQRTVARGMGTVGRNESIRPKHDYSDDYIG